MEKDGLAGQRDLHVCVEHAIRERGWNLLADDRFDRALVGKHDRPALLKGLANTCRNVAT